MRLRRRATNTSVTNRRTTSGIDRFSYERELASAGKRGIVGVDEAGRGPLAGPVVVAAVMLPFAWIRVGMPAPFRDLNDSKLLTAERRSRFCRMLFEQESIAWAVCAVGPGRIDRLNILRATHYGMKRVVAKLGGRVDHVLVDGLPVAAIEQEQTALVKGDSKSYSIAAASVIAKTLRDRRMRRYHRQFPDYGFASHKGYPTREHLAALERYGPCRIHRRSFAPVRQLTLPLREPEAIGKTPSL